MQLTLNFHLTISSLGQVYEFKVSYPATMPFDFTLTFAKSHPVLGESIPQVLLVGGGV